MEQLESGIRQGKVRSPRTSLSRMKAIRVNRIIHDLIVHADL
jgi:hypothetical protein